MAPEVSRKALLVPVCQAATVTAAAHCSLLQSQRMPAVPGKVHTPWCGTAQVLRGLKYSGRRVDIWSCGVVLYTMVSGDYP
jgi:serine/threonine protein kinase